MTSAGIDNAEGVNFSVPRKSEMASLLKQRMSNHKFFYPMLSWERPYRGDICTELNVERYDLRKDGAIGFSHPNGTHDDVFWATLWLFMRLVEMSPEPVCNSGAKVTMRNRRERFRIRKCHRIYDRVQGKFSFNISYETHTKITPRSLVVAEAFGLGIDEAQKFKVLDAELKIGPKRHRIHYWRFRAVAKVFCLRQSGQILATKQSTFPRSRWIRTNR